MRIKMLKKCIVGKNADPVSVGGVVEADDAEAKALIAVGYAKETTEKTDAEKAAEKAAAGDAEKAAAATENKDGANAVSNKAK